MLPSMCPNLELSQWQSRSVTNWMGAVEPESEEQTQDEASAIWLLRDVPLSVVSKVN